MKNHKFLIDQVSALKNYNFKLLIIGSGILESSLRAQVDELNLNKKVEFLGSRDDVPSILSQTDCLLLPFIVVINVFDGSLLCARNAFDGRNFVARNV